jgi:hypothetical protein
VTQGTSTDRRPWLAAALLLLLAAGLLLGTDLLTPSADDGDVAGRTRIENADMLGVSDSDAPSTHGQLVGDPEAVARRAGRGRTRGPATVTVLGPNEVPLSKVFVVLGGIKVEGRKARIPVREQLTDALGRARFADVPYDGSAYVGLRVQQIPPENVSFLTVESTDVNIFRVLADTPGMRLHSIKGPNATLRTRVGLPFDLQFVDAVTGRRVRGATGSVWPGFEGAWGKAAPPGAPAAIGRGLKCHYRIAVDVPPGYAPFPHRIRNSRSLHPDVTRATHTVALHREAEVVLVAKRGATLPSLEGSNLQMGTGHQFRLAEFDTPDGFGRVRVKGFPFVPYVPVQVYWSFAKGGYATGKGRFGATHAEGLVIELDVVAASETADMDEVIEDVEEREILDGEPFGESEGASAPAEVRVILDIKRPDGTPATLAHVEFGQVKAQIRPEDKGRRDWSVRPGTHDVLVWGAGADLRTQVEIGSDATQTVRLQGTEGGRLRVSVRDEKGRVLPHARVTITGPVNQWAQCDVKDGHQRLDSLTNAQGERTFHLVAVGRCQVHIRYGGFYFTKSVEIREGRTTKLDYVMEFSR